MAIYGINPAGGWDFLDHAAALAAIGNGSEMHFSEGEHLVVGTSHTKTGLIYRPAVDGQIWSFRRTSGSGPALLFYTGCDIDGGLGGLTISGGTNGLEGNGTSRTIALRRTRLTDNTAIGLYRPATGSTVKECEFDNLGTLGISVISSQVIAVTASKFWAIQNDGINGPGCSVDRSSFSGNNAGGVGTAQCNLGTTGTATECIAEGGGLIGIRASASVRGASSGNAGADYAVTTNTSPITGPVGFTNAAAGDLTIGPDSPAYHAGQPSAVLTDFSGQLYDGATPSIGAHEYIAPSPPDLLTPYQASLWERLDVVDLIRIAIGTRGTDPQGGGPAGWWADSFSPDDYRIGWRIDLLERSTSSPEQVETIRASLARSLRFIVADGHADSVTVTADRQGAGLSLSVVVSRDESAGGPFTLKYPDLWEAIRNGTA